MNPSFIFALASFTLFLLSCNNNNNNNNTDRQHNVTPIITLEGLLDADFHGSAVEYMEGHYTDSFFDAKTHMYHFFPVSTGRFTGEMVYDTLLGFQFKTGK